VPISTLSTWIENFSQNENIPDKRINNHRPTRKKTSELFQSRSLDPNIQYGDFFLIFYICSKLKKISFKKQNPLMIFKIGIPT